MRKFSLCALLLIAACNKPTEKAAAPVEPTPTPAAATAAPSSQSAVSAAAQAVPTTPATAGGLTWNHAAPLARRAPKNQMRAAEYGVEGDSMTELSVFYFGPDQPGRSVVEPNVTRWLGQLTQTDGSDTSQKAKRSKLKVGELSVSLVEASGTYSGGMSMPGSPAVAPVPDAMLLGAIASGPKGAVFFKMVGPRNVVEQARPAMLALLNSLRLE